MKEFTHKPISRLKIFGAFIVLACVATWMISPAITACLLPFLLAGFLIDHYKKYAAKKFNTFKKNITEYTVLCNQNTDDLNKINETLDQQYKKKEIIFNLLCKGVEFYAKKNGLLNPEVLNQSQQEQENSTKTRGKLSEISEIKEKLVSLRKAYPKLPAIPKNDEVLILIDERKKHHLMILRLHEQFMEKSEIFNEQTLKEIEDSEWFKEYINIEFQSSLPKTGTRAELFARNR